MQSRDSIVERAKHVEGLVAADRRVDDDVEPAPHLVPDALLEVLRVAPPAGGVLRPLGDAVAGEEPCGRALAHQNRADPG